VYVWEKKTLLPKITPNLLLLHLQRKNLNLKPKRLLKGKPLQGAKKKDGEIARRKIEGAEDGDIKDKYIIGEEIGRGGFSVVCEATRRDDSEKYAVKIVEKTLIQEDIKLLKREIEIMKKSRTR